MLKQNENDDLLAELHELKDTLDDMDGEITVYDEDLIRSVIQYATVLSDTELRIHIKAAGSDRTASAILYQEVQKKMIIRLDTRWKTAD